MENVDPIMEDPDKIINPKLPEVAPMKPENKPGKEKVEPFHTSPEISPVPQPDIKPEKPK